MRLVMDTQVRLTEFNAASTKDSFIKSLGESKNYVIVNDTSIFIWDYLDTLDNEKVFNSFCIIDDIILLVDSETQDYEAYRNGEKFDHVMFKNISHWIKIKYDKDNKRLLRKMKIFREELLNKELDPTYYRGIHSDRFSVLLKGQEILTVAWSDRYDKKLLGLEENFSFFLKICKLVL